MCITLWSHWTGVRSNILIINYFALNFINILLTTLSCSLHFRFTHLITPKCNDNSIQTQNSLTVRGNIKLIKVTKRWEAKNRQRREKVLKTDRWGWKQDLHCWDSWEGWGVLLRLVSLSCVIKTHSASHQLKMTPVTIECESCCLRCIVSLQGIHPLRDKCISVANESYMDTVSFQTNSQF